MTRRKKIIISATVALTMVSLFGLVLIAGAFGPGHAFHKRGMPPFMKKEISEFVLWKMDKSAKDLNLSNIQQEKYSSFRKKMEATINTGIETRLGFKEQAKAEFEKEAPDLSSLTLDLQSHIEQTSSQLSENLALFNTFYNSLDASQKKQITDHIKEKHRSCRR